MSDDKPESTIDMPFQASSDACVMVTLRKNYRLQIIRKGALCMSRPLFLKLS